MDSANQVEIKEKVLKFESYINDRLKEDLRALHSQWEIKTVDMNEWVQLKSIIQTMQETQMKSFKGKMDIGANIFVQVAVPDTSTIIVNIGANTYVQFTLEEALKWLEVRINIIQKELDVINEASCDVKARIKLVLHGIQELEKIK